MQKLLTKISELKSSEISKVIEERLSEFEGVDDLFSELCFCLMTAGFRADKSIEIQKKIGKGFLNLSLEELKVKLKELGHRFWPQRAERIVRAREHKNYLKDLVKKDSKEAREWLSENIYGMGFKEASHYLRNIGKRDIAIVDFHIVDLLEREGLIEKPKTISKKIYLEIENVLKELGKKLGIDLAELDLYLWYMETGKVLK